MKFYVDKETGKLLTYGSRDKALYSENDDDIIIEPISITENGRYVAPDGKAYSPVNVNVALPRDTTALASDIQKGKTAYILGQKVTGTAEMRYDSITEELTIPEWMVNLE